MQIVGSVRWWCAGLVLWNCQHTRGAAAPSDDQALLQSSVNTQAHAEPAASNGTELAQYLGADGCPASRADALTVLHRCARITASRDLGSECDDDGEKQERWEGEKHVYFLRHAVWQCSHDAGLSDYGVAQCKALRRNNTLIHRALFGEPWDRVEVVFTSPSTRTLETAVRLFGESAVPIILDHRLVEDSNRFDVPCIACAEGMLKALNQSDLLKQYHALMEEGGGLTANFFTQDAPLNAWGDDPGGRVASFTRDLLQRKEQNIAVVSHYWTLQHFHVGAGCMNMGEDVALGSLSREGEWRRLWKDSCNMGQRRWHMREH